ncbi:hypothetical protein [Papillibacter cinnamivorans]|uniref:Lipoprotein n=1 Tax=Papillibacter cinnamivorans DSM 12816 TaxID=1122930 RepID=A0A1W2CK56_9FIRM|nr:hypothetical protein [Papillibacter cinnamivorans]SMC85615.1 hypothetical protein SAMN02745168_0043 [Papillibacter cinnamivorans DSM 12816]
MKKIACLVMSAALLFVLVSGCNSSSAPTASPSPTGEPLPENLFSMDTVREGEQYGAMTVSSVEKSEDYTSVKFSGEVTISGTWSSDSSGLMGEYITLNLDEDSMAKIPALSESDIEVVLDPVLTENKDVLTQFGPTGATGTFTITISALTVTDQEESFPRTAVLKEILDLV